MSQGVEGKAAIIDRPVEEVWNFMLDISNMPKWEDGRAEWKQTSEGPIEVGTTFQSSIPLLGRQIVTHLRVAEFEPNRKFAVEGLDTFMRGTKIRYLMTPIEGGKTRLCRETEVEVHGVAKVLRPLMAPIVRWTGGVEANNIKRLVETQT